MRNDINLFLLSTLCDKEIHKRYIFISIKLEKTMVILKIKFHFKITITTLQNYCWIY